MAKNNFLEYFKWAKIHFFFFENYYFWKFDHPTAQDEWEKALGCDPAFVATTFRSQTTKYSPFFILAIEAKKYVVNSTCLIQVAAIEKNELERPSSIGKFFCVLHLCTFFFDTMLDLIRMMNWMCLWLSTEWSNEWSFFEGSSVNHKES